MGNNPSRFRDKPQNPVENVSWDDAQVFCQKLNQMTQMRGKKYRLPSEAEWEYACRAGTQTRYYFGDDASQLKEHAWFGDNSGKLILDTTEIWSEDQYNYYERIIDNDCKTHPVGQKTSNNWGLYDMHGNVWEWCEDGWHENHKNAPTDGSAWNDSHSQANSRSLRGSSWCGNPRCCRSANRFWYNTDNLDDNIGFRLALFLP
jgi:formylglycine-generating enzyme required for sulfatase activity